MVTIAGRKAVRSVGRMNRAPVQGPKRGSSKTGVTRRRLNRA